MDIFDYPPPDINEIASPDWTPPLLPWMNQAQTEAPLQQFARPGPADARNVAIWFRQNRGVVLAGAALVLVMIIDRVTMK